MGSTVCLSVSSDYTFSLYLYNLLLQVVLLSGHLDSWDVGQGAMDDGGGAMISWEALSLIKDLGNIQRNTYSKSQINFSNDNMCILQNAMKAQVYQFCLNVNQKKEMANVPIHVINLKHFTFDQQSILCLFLFI